MSKKIGLHATMLMVFLLLLSCSGRADTTTIVDDALTEPTATTTTDGIPTATAVLTTQDDASPALKQTSATVYTHPAGLFTVTPFGSEYEEIDGLTIFYGQNELVVAFAYEEEVSLSEDNLAPVVDILLNEILLESGFAEDYEIYVDDAEMVNDGYLVFLEYTSPDNGAGAGEIFVKREGPATGLILLTQDYNAAADAWWATIESFQHGASADPVVAEAKPEAETATSSGTRIADNGFRPNAHGFSFYNYGNSDVQFNLTPAELQRLFGDQVCASLANDTCILTPPANQWLSQMNGYMDGGHCEGMAVLSSLFYHDQFDQITPTTFGVTQAADLSLSNEALQREIAYWWTTQTLHPAASHTVDESPQVVLDTLIETFKQGQAAPEIWAMGIYKSDFTGGHAITPFAVEDKGNGFFDILVYDNNFPGETRAVHIDTNTNTWKYQASTNPDVPQERYDGDAVSRNLEIVAIYPRLQQQECPFCQTEQLGRLSAGLAAPQAEFYEVWLDGDADLLIIDENGKRIGFDQGQFVNEIENAETLNVRFDGVNVWEAENEPIYRVPVGTAFEIIIDGTRLTEAGLSDVSLIGPGFFVAVEEIWLEPGDMDSILIETDEARYHLSYATDYIDSPLMVLGVETDEADYAFLVQATELTGIEDTFDVAIDLVVGDFIIDTSFNEDDTTYEAYVLRIDDNGEAVFGGPDLILAPETTLYLNYLEWVEDGTVMFADFDYNGDGEIDESIELLDEADYDFFGEDE